MSSFHVSAVALLAAGIIAASNAQAQTPSIRIMPLGDSITYGSNTPGGYRYPLYVALTNAGYNIDYVGTQTGNTTNLLPDANHEGHSGWIISGGTSALYEFCRDWFNVIADPDVVLLHIGTNDFGKTNSIATAIDRLDALVSWIATNRPHANIIVTTLLPRGEPYNTWINTYFNPYVATKVAGQQALGRKVHYLDMASHLTLADTFDNLHPNAEGYAKMADAWFTAITNIVGTTGDSEAPAISRVLGITNLTQVAVTFSKPLAPETATNLSNYAIDGGLAITDAALSSDQRTVTLTTSAQTRNTDYTLTVSNVADVTPSALTIAPGSTAIFRAVCRGYLLNVPESSAYNLVYALDLPSSAQYGIYAPQYAVDNTALYNGSAIHKLAYYVELQVPNGPFTYLWVSADPYTNDLSLIGVPAVGTGAVHQKRLTGVTIDSNDAGIATGSDLVANVEFWPSNYTTAAGLNLPGANGGTFDFDDTPTPGTYGSMQIHNYAAQQTLFTFSNWGSTGGTTPDIGIGNCPNPKNGGYDWTFANNASMYQIKSVQILALRDTDTTPPTLVSAQAGIAGNLIAVMFSEPLLADSVSGTRFSLDNGVAIISATLLPDQRTVNLATTAQPQGVPLTLTVTGIRDGAGGNLIAAGSTIAVTDPSVLPSEITANAGALADGYRLVYTLEIPVKGYFIGSNSFYRFNQSLATGSFDRVAYYVELKTSKGATQYLWTSMDAFTPYLSRIGVPTSASKGSYVGLVNNLDVKSNVAGVSNGVGMAGGNLEFWYGNYSQTNALAIANASDSVYDWGDRMDSGGHGSMQIHNAGLSQVLFAMNNWGTDNQLLAVGIGNRSGTSNTDWTFANNAGTEYLRRIMHILVRPGNMATNSLPPPANVTDNVPAASNYLHVYTIDLPVKGSFNTNSPAYYSINNWTNIGPFSRVAYYMELQSGSDPTQWIWTAMDAFTTDARKLGVPTNNCVFQQGVTNLDVFSNVGGIVTGTSIPSGNIEFWPYDYSAGNGIGIPNASASTYDFGDTRSSGGSYGSMQVHNYGADATQTLFAVNCFNNNNTLCIGIGNCPSPVSGGVDWTFKGNAGSYNYRRLYVFVQPGGDTTTPDTTRPTVAVASGALALNRVALFFSETLADSAADPALYAINNGITVLDAKLHANQKTVILTTSTQTAGTTYTVTLNGVRDRSANGNPILSNTTIAFTAPTPDRPSVLTNIPEAADYALINTLALSNTAYYTYGANYSLDESLWQTQTVDRVAYCLELTGTNGVSKWAYVSMDAFTSDLFKIGLPTANRAILFQQYVSNLNVYAYSSDGNPGVTNVTGLAAGNIEFWPSNYGASNDKSIPGASGSTYDFGDGGGPSATTAGHGSMQIHNFASGYTILSVTHCGVNGNVPALGIGNNPAWSNNDPDWTFTYTAPQYAVKNLYVLAHWGPTPAYLLAGTSPQINVDPVSKTVRSGESATFFAQISGATAYQWRHNGIWIVGATQSWLTIDPAELDDAGTYDVLAFGTGTAYAVSGSATLTVIPQGTLMKLR